MAELRMIMLVAVLVVTGCSGSDDGSDEGSSGLLGALERVRATAESKKLVEYGAPARIPGGDKFRGLEGFGYGQIASTSRLIKDELGLDLTKFGSGVVAGQPPHQVGALWGDYDVDALAGKLRERGVKEEKADLTGTVWRSAGDYKIELDDGPFTGVVQLNQFNVVRTAPKSFAYAPAASEVDWVTSPGDHTLADDGTIGPLARCLGDVVAAELADTEQAVGVRADGTEVICLDADKGAVEKALKGTVPSTNQPWDELLPGAKVDESDGRTRVTVPAGDRPAGRVLNAMLTGDLRELD